ncbi:hypothetical protein SADUNF_Sadunf06G0049700 [Salix dunnii]|uniref:Uncharacterized protein n=1 Tax=Salix dunnii TaxID=1413687 RepID=A0A835K5K4_9ROSI|nr:hypothetical protein SADUNF_Sadunf06G0049700 [Salix dunnii]
MIDRLASLKVSPALLLGSKPEFKKGLWKPEEDLILKTHVETHGEGHWSTVSKRSGKNIDSKLDQNDKNTKKQNKSNSQPTRNTIPIGSSGELEGKNQEKEERGAVSDAWIQRDAQSMNYYIESPMVLDNNATFIFEDEPFLAHWDSLVMFESLGFGGDW